MTTAGATQRSYTDEERAAADLVVDMNHGYVLPSAVQLGMPRGTLQHMVQRDDPARDAARRVLSEQTKVSDLAERFLELAKAGADHALANLDKASPYHGALIGAIALDKWALITGRPTSRTEVLRARYVEPGALRSLSTAIVDTEAQRVRGVESGAGPSHLPAQEKRPSRSRSKKQMDGRTVASRAVSFKQQDATRGTNAPVEKDARESVSKDPDSGRAAAVDGPAT